MEQSAYLIQDCLKDTAYVTGQCMEVLVIGNGIIILNGLYGCTGRKESVSVALTMKQMLVLRPKRPLAASIFKGDRLSRH